MFIIPLLSSNSAVSYAFPALWIFNINDLLNLQPRLDLQESFTHCTTNEEGETVEGIYKLPSMIVRNIELLQQWYYEHTSPTVNVWFTLNETTFEQWKLIRFHLTGNNGPTTVIETPTPPTPPTPTPIPSNVPVVTEATTFLRSIKRSPSDYTKFKDDMRWKQWH